MTLAHSCLHYIKRCLPMAVLLACTSLANAAVIQTLSIDLSPLHAGSVLSGSITLTNPLMLGDSALIPLAFSDPSNYGPAAIIATLSVTSGVLDDQFRFSGVSFTNLSNSKVYNLTVVGAAICFVDFPCTATGGYQANSPPAFSGTYTVSSTTAPSGVPEPSYSYLLSGILPALVLARRLSGRRLTT